MIQVCFDPGWLVYYNKHFDGLDIPPGTDLELSAYFDTEQELISWVMNMMVPENHEGHRSKFFEYTTGLDYITCDNSILSWITGIHNVSIDSFSSYYESFLGDLEEMVRKKFDDQKAEYMSEIRKHKKEKFDKDKEARRKKYLELKKEFENE